MPLYDFRCRACGATFEALVRPGHAPACPACGAPDLERLLSSFAVSSAERTKAAATKARRTAAAVGQADTRALEREGERHRHEDH